jgi:hypothetical protein
MMDNPTMIRAIGQVADDAANVAAELPLKIGAVAEDVPTAVTDVTDADKVHLVADLKRRLWAHAVGGVADAAANVTTEHPLKMGAVAEAAPAGTGIADGDIAHLITDLYRRLRVLAEGATADDAQDSANLNPVKIGARAVSNAAPENLDVIDAGDVGHLITDTMRRLLVNGCGNQADGAVADSANPVKIGAVAETTVAGTGVANADIVHLVTDLYRRLRVVQVPQVLTVSWADLSNVSADAYYPSEGGLDTDVYGTITLTGKVICGADNTSVLTIEVTNDEDATPGNRDWQAIYVYSNLTDDVLNQVATLAGATSQIAISLNDLGFKYVRAKYDITRPAANNDTVILKAQYRAR